MAAVATSINEEELFELPVTNDATNLLAHLKQEKQNREARELYEFLPVSNENIHLVKQLHDQLFPIKYGDSFYSSLLRNQYVTLLLFTKRKPKNNNNNNNNNNKDDGLYDLTSKISALSPKSNCNDNKENKDNNDSNDNNTTMMTSGPHSNTNTKNKNKDTNNKPNELIKKLQNDEITMNDALPDLAGVSTFRVEMRQIDSEWPPYEPIVKYVGYLATFGVSSKYRRRGLAKILLMKSIEKMFSIGCDYIELHVLTTNYQAISLYKQFGFEIKMELPNHYYFNDKNHDALLLIKVNNNKNWKQQQNKNKNENKNENENKIEKNRKNRKNENNNDEFSETPNRYQNDKENSRSGHELLPPPLSRSQSQSQSKSQRRQQSERSQEDENDDDEFETALLSNDLSDINDNRHDDAPPISRTPSPMPTVARNNNKQHNNNNNENNNTSNINQSQNRNKNKNNKNKNDYFTKNRNSASKKSNDGIAGMNVSNEQMGLISQDNDSDDNDSNDGYNANNFGKGASIGLRMPNVDDYDISLLNGDTRLSSNSISMDYYIGDIMNKFYEKCTIL